VTQPIPFDPVDPEYTAEPQAYYTRLRKTAPVQRATLPDGQAVWLLTRYADVEAALADPRLVKDPQNARSPDALARMPARPEAMRYFRTNMLSRDPPSTTLGSSV
jgi:cytochrome P450